MKLYSVSSKTRSLTFCFLELLPPLLNLTPNIRYMLSGDNFTLQCPEVSKADPSSSKLKFVTPNFTAQDLPLSGAGASITATNGTGGLYWCENAEGRSNAVNVTVSCEFFVTINC